MNKKGKVSTWNEYNRYIDDYISLILVFIGWFEFILGATIIFVGLVTFTLFLILCGTFMISAPIIGALIAKHYHISINLWGYANKVFKK